MSHKRLFFLIIILVLGAVFYKFAPKGFLNHPFNQLANQANSTNQAPTDKLVSIAINPNDTFANLMNAQAGIDPNDTLAIFDAAKKVYDLSQIKANNTINLHFDLKTNALIKLVYQTDSDNELWVTKSNDQWAAELQKINYEIKIKNVSGTIQTSLYQSAVDQNVDIRAIIALADAFQWTIDFAMDPKVGDTYKFIYEERYRDGKYVMPGNILAGKFVNEGQPYFVYYFEDGVDNSGFFDENANSVQKIFLKAPISFKYISSGYTNGIRCLEGRTSCMHHRAIDYAAPSGTPIRSVGDGTVIFAGRSSVGYGNFTKIRHNGTYETHYAHQSKIIVKVGQKVTQGQIIGYVGSTGNSTGPHLHFEMQKYGTLVNPLKEILPPGKPISEANKQNFINTIKQYQDQLK